MQLRMNRVDVRAEAAPLPDWSGALARYAEKVLAELGRDAWDLSVLLCGDRTIRELNARYRGKDEATDVLSFSLGVFVAEELPDGEEGAARWLPGDIVISLDTLRENALYFQTTEDEELRRLVIHGILHLDGMDHRTNSSDEPMIAVQENILAQFRDDHILPGGAGR